MQHQGNFGRDIHKLDASQLQQVQESIRAYHAQGLSNDPRCKSLENLVKEFTLRQTSSVAIQRGILSQTPQMSYNQQSPYSQGNRLNGGRDSHAVLNNFLVQGAANELRQRSQAQGQGFVNTSNLVHEQRQMNLFPTSSSQFQQQPNYQQQGNMRGEPLYQNNNFNQKPSYVMGGQPNNVFLSSQNTDQRRSNNNVNAGHGPGTASSNFSSQYSTFSRQNPGNLQNAGNVQVVQQSAHHPLAGYSTSHGVTGAPQHPYKSSGTQNQQVMVGNQAGVVGNQSSMRNMGLKWNGSEQNPQPSVPQQRPPRSGEQIPGYGFTRQQLVTLKSQIHAIKRLKKGEKMLSQELLKAIVPPPLQPELKIPKKQEIGKQVQGTNLQLSLQNHVGSPQPIQPAMVVKTQADMKLQYNQGIMNAQVGGTSSSFPATTASLAGPSTLRQIIDMGKTKAALEEEQQKQKAEERKKKRMEQRKLKEANLKVEGQMNPPQLFNNSGMNIQKDQVNQFQPSVEAILGQFTGMGGALAAYIPALPKKVEVQLEKPSTKPLYRAVTDDPNEQKSILWLSAQKVSYDLSELLDVELQKILEEQQSKKLEELNLLLGGNEGGVPAGGENSTEKQTRSKSSGLQAQKKVKLRIQQKMLNLAKLQKSVRQAVEEEQLDIAEMGDRAYRTFLRQCERQKNEMAKQTMQALKASRDKFLKAMVQGRKKFLEVQWNAKDARTIRNRGVLKLHEKLLRENAKKKDEDRTKRMEALKNNDVDAYREMLKKQQTEMMPGDSRAERYEILSSFLTKTEDYLKKLGGKISAVKNQQELDDAAWTAMAEARAQGLTEEEIREAGEQAIEACRRSMWEDDSGNASGAAAVSKYYAMAHSISEKITKQPSMLSAGTLREYQMVGLQWMLSLYNNRLNGILADEMGLGKTVQVMALIAHLMEAKGNYGPHLIIVPNAVMVNWKSELLRWLPTVNCVYYVGSREQRTKIYTQEMAAQKFNVLVTTYEFVMRDRAKLSKVDWKYMVIDEAQRMKDRESRLSRDLDKFRCQRRLLLTGTPLQNDLQELWSLLNLLLPDVFDSSRIFLDWFDKPFQGKGSAADEEDEWLETEKKVIVIHRLHQILEPFMLRRRVEDVEGSLPPKVPVVIKCKMSSYQSAIYDWVKATGTLKLDPEMEAERVAIKTKAQIRTFAPLQNQCMELKKVCNHPFLSYPPRGYLPPEVLVGTCGKLYILDRILTKLKETGHKVLLFSTMTKLLDILEDYLVWKGFKFRRIDGTTPLDMREESIVEFNRPGSECFIFLLSIRAAGRGLNLQSADTVVIYDPDPNPKNEEQAVARAHRIGQKREVRVIYLEAVVEAKPFFKREDEERARKLKKDWEKIDRKLRKLESKGKIDSEKGQSLQAKLAKVTRKLDEEGTVDEDEEDFDGSDPYVGSIETLIRNTIQQHKIEMADEVINAGRFDQLTTQEERRMTLEALLHDEERYQERLHAVPTMEDINRQIARSEEEAKLFDQMDKERQWPEFIDSRSDVPPWMRCGGKEVRRVQAMNAKPSSRGGRGRGSRFIPPVVEEEDLGRGARTRRKALEQKPTYQETVFTKKEEEVSEGYKSSDQEAEPTYVAPVKPVKKEKVVEGEIAFRKDLEEETFEEEVEKDVEEIKESEEEEGIIEEMEVEEGGESEQEELPSGSGGKPSENGTEEWQVEEEEEEEVEEEEVAEEGIDSLESPKPWMGNEEQENEEIGSSGEEEAEDSGEENSGEDDELESRSIELIPEDLKSRKVDEAIIGLSGNKRKRTSRSKPSKIGSMAENPTKGEEDDSEELSWPLGKRKTKAKKKRPSVLPEFYDSDSAGEKENGDDEGLYRIETGTEVEGESFDGKEEEFLHPKDEENREIQSSEEKEEGEIKTEDEESFGEVGIERRDYKVKRHSESSSDSGV